MSMPDPGAKTDRGAGLGGIARRVAVGLAALLAPLNLALGGDITLTARPAPAIWGTAVTLRAMVSATDGRSPSGRLVFTDDGVPLAAADLVGLGVDGALSGPYDHVCALGADGLPWCWGAGGDGRLGNGDGADVSRPVAVATALPRPAAIAAGGEHACSVSTGGAVHCWGNGARGQLATGDRASSATPVPVPALSEGIVAISLGASHGCALTRAGGVLCWGAGTMRQIGDGDAVDRPAPVPVVGLASGVTAIAVGGAHGCALTEARTVRCWGSNLLGQVGDGTRIARATPVEVVGLADVVAISAGDLHSCAVLASGAAKCWGLNDDGRLGDGTTTQRSLPTDVVDLPAPLAAISAGAAHTCAVTTAGAAQCWGYGNEGRLGNATTATSSVPVAVTGLEAHVVAISAGGRQTCAQRDDGVVECWGAGRYGQLGDGGWTARSTPAPVADLLSPPRGRAEVTITDLEVGRHALVAAEDVAPGDPAAVSAPFDLVIDRAASHAELAASAATSQRGETVSLTATLTGRAVPTGLVRFGDGSSALATVPVGSDGRATTAVVLPVGDHTLTATYDGDAHHTGTASAALVHAVAPGATAATLTASDDRVPLGAPLTLTVRAAPVAPAAGTVGGTVAFTEGATPLGTATLAEGTADLRITDLEPGVHAFSATTSGDGDFTGSQAPPIEVEVARGATTTRLAADATRLLPGAPLTLTARVTPIAPAGGIATGLVDFDEGTTHLGSAALAEGVATLAIASTASGDHPVTARYRGSTRFFDSTSATTAVTVDPRVGPEFRLNGVTLGSQRRAATATLASGDHLAVWTSRPLAGRGEIRARRLRADGTAIGGETRIDTPARANRGDPAIAAGANGGAVVLWREVADDGRDLGLRGRRLSATGARLGAEFRVDTSSGRRLTAPALAAAGGGFAVAWGSQGTTAPARQILVRLHDAAGRPITGETRADAAAALVAATPPAIAALGAGGWVVAWTATARSGGTPTVHVQRLTARGTRIGGEAVISPAGFAARDVAVAATGDGGFVVAWIADLGAAAGRGVFLRRHRANGTAAAAAQRVDTSPAGDRSDLAIAARPGGGWLVAWSTNGRDGAGRSVHARRFDASGIAIDVEYRLNTTVAGDQLEPSVAYRGPNAFLAAWTSRGQDGSLEGVFAQRFATAP